MRAICFYFQVHQPFRLRSYRFFDIGSDHYYFDEYRNKYIMRRVADKCYLPMNRLLLELIKEYGSRFKVSFSISGTALDQFALYAPDVLDTYIELAETGCVEFLAETYSHSLSSLRSREEFFRQVDAQRKKIVKYFKKDSVTFRNTELIYSDGIGEMVAEMGFRTMLTEGAKHVLGWKSPNFMYCNAINPKLKLLLKNFQLSDDIAFRFSQQSWDAWPVTTEKYVDWLNSIPQDEQTVNLFMDYETFGEHQWKETGIFDFMRALPARVFSHSNFGFHTPSELSEILQPVAEVHVPYPISWADEERDLTAWLGNELQDDAFSKLYELEDRVKNTHDEQIQTDWKYLQTSDHFYYMCTKWFSDGDVHKYFNPYNTPYEAFINFMNILSDFAIRINDIHPVNYIEKSSTQFSEKPLNPDQKTEIARKTVQKAKNSKKVNIRSFEDLIKLSKTGLRNLVKGADGKTIYYALAGSENKVKKALILYLGKLQLKEYNELITANHPVTITDTEKARKSLLAKMKQLI